MSKSKQSEAQIIAALKQVEAGRTVEDLARRCGVSKHTIYAWKLKYGDGIERSARGQAATRRELAAEEDGRRLSLAARVVRRDKTGVEL